MRQIVATAAGVLRFLANGRHLGLCVPYAHHVYVLRTICTPRVRTAYHMHTTCTYCVPYAHHVYVLRTSTPRVRTAYHMHTTCTYQMNTQVKEPQKRTLNPRLYQPSQCRFYWHLLIEIFHLWVAKETCL